MISSALRPMRTGMALMLFTLGHLTAWGQSGGGEKPEPAAIVWINSFYGPNNSGVGLAARYSVLGIGATVFGFAGDTTARVGVRPGIIGASIDAYLAIDCSRWLALYGNVGVGARLKTYEQQGAEHELTFPKRSLLSVGGGVQISLVSHVMLGIGCNFLVDVPEKEGAVTHGPIQSIVAQLGYRI